MFQSSPDAELVDRIFRRELSKALRSASILYLVNAAGIFLIGSGLRFFFPFWPVGQSETFLEVFFAAVAIYGVIAYFLSRSRRGAGLRAHAYVLGILGLTGGGIFFALGAIGFLSAGYWLGQFQGSSGMKCVRDGGEVVAFGQESLVCRRCSKLVKIGLDLPRRLTFTGLGLINTGVALFLLASIMPVFAGLFYASVNVPLVLILDGVFLSLEPLYLQRTLFGGGYVRLPPDPSSPGPARY